MFSRGQGENYGGPRHTENHRPGGLLRKSVGRIFVWDGLSSPSKGHSGRQNDRLEGRSHMREDFFNGLLARDHFLALE